MEFILNGQFRTEQPLEGYRQWVFDDVCERYRKSRMGIELSEELRKET